MNAKHFELSPAQVTFLKKNFEVFTFVSDFTCFHEGHIPLTGIVLLDGQIDIHKNSQFIQRLPRNVLLGLPQLLKNKKLGLTCVIKKDSKVLLPGKYYLQSFLKEGSLKLSL